MKPLACPATLVGEEGVGVGVGVGSTSTSNTHPSSSNISNSSNSSRGGIMRVVVVVVVVCHVGLNIVWRGCWGEHLQSIGWDLGALEQRGYPGRPTGGLGLTHHLGGGWKGSTGERGEGEERI